MTDFKSRRHLAMMLLLEVTNDYDNLHEMFINRSNLLAESFESITGGEIAALYGPMHIGFINEEATGPGVLREWFLLVCQAIFNPQNALFVACPTDQAFELDYYSIRMCKLYAKTSVDNIGNYEVTSLGKSGLFPYVFIIINFIALMRKMQVGIVFARAFFLQLAGIDVSLEDMDPSVIDQDVLGLTFIWEVDQESCGASSSWKKY
ncbi:E3 ubiquitin protein ligase UPL5-like protein [Tanacetum coccineum]